MLENNSTKKEREKKKLTATVITAVGRGSREYILSAARVGLFARNPSEKKTFNFCFLLSRENRRFCIPFYFKFPNREADVSL